MSECQEGGELAFEGGNRGASQSWDRRLNAWPECWLVHGELIGIEMQHGAELGRFHQQCVDAYGAQHPGDGSGICVVLHLHFAPAIGPNSADPPPDAGAAFWMLDACYAPLLAWRPLLAVVTVAYYRRRRSEIRHRHPARSR